MFLNPKSSSKIDKPQILNNDFFFHLRVWRQREHKIIWFDICVDNLACSEFMGDQEHTDCVKANIIKSGLLLMGIAPKIGAE